MIPWDDLDLWRYFGGYVCGFYRAYGVAVRWGGDWDGDLRFTDQSFNDLGHFELLNITHIRS